MYPVQVVTPQFRMLYSFLCSGYGRSRFSRVVGLGSFVFHYWGGEIVRACGYVGFLLCFFVGFALTAIGSFVLFGNVTG